MKITFKENKVLFASDDVNRNLACPGERANQIKDNVYTFDVETFKKYNITDINMDKDIISVNENLVGRIWNSFRDEGWKKPVK